MALGFLLWGGLRWASRQAFPIPATTPLAAEHPPELPAATPGEHLARVRVLSEGRRLRLDAAAGGGQTWLHEVELVELLSDTPLPRRLAVAAASRLPREEVVALRLSPLETTAAEPVGPLPLFLAAPPRPPSALPPPD